MAKERTYAFFPGTIVNAQSVDVPSLPYDRAVLRLILAVQGTAPIATSLAVQLTLADVTQTGTYSLSAASRYVEIDVSGDAINIPADVVPGIIISNAASATNLVVWIESEPAIDLGDETVWVALTVADLQSGIASPIYNQFSSAVMKEGQADPLPEIILNAVNRIRQAVRSGRKVSLGPNGTIPPSLRGDAIALAKYQFFSRSSALKAFVEEARTSAKDALDLFTRIAQGKETPETPSSPLTDESPNISAWGSDTKIDL